MLNEVLVVRAEQLIGLTHPPKKTKVDNLDVVYLKKLWLGNTGGKR